MDALPAVLGGSPLFPQGLPLVRPSLPDSKAILDDVAAILASRVLTKGPYVDLLEQRAALYLGVEHCVAVSSCTSGLMLLLRAASLEGNVIVPSFTFPATVHSVVWNGLSPLFADVESATLTLSPDAVLAAITSRTSALLATHTYGTPCDIDGLTKTAHERGIRIFFDAAHAFGARHDGFAIGRFGDAEVFSLAPTKLLVGGEGGLIATNDSALAEACRIGRDYGNPGDYNCRLIGLNARLSEMHAAVALASLKDIDERIERRNRLAFLYWQALEDVPGIRFPQVRSKDRSTYKDFTLLVNEEEFGLSAVGLANSLSAEGIETRRYFAPAVHEMQAYLHLMGGTDWKLPITQQAVRQVLTIPLWPDMTEGEVLRVALAIRRIGRACKAISTRTPFEEETSAPRTALC